MSAINPHRARGGIRGTVVRGAVPVLVGLGLAGCAGLGPLAPMAVKLGKNLLSAATENYDSGYAKALGSMLDVMNTRVPTSGVGTPIIAHAATAADGGATPADQRSAGGQGSESARATLEPLEIEFDLLREVAIDGQVQVVQIPDGATLMDGRGDPNAGDNFKLVVEPRSECYVYLMLIDATGWAQPLFPIGFVQGSNPVPAGQRLEIPADDWFYLDQNRGVETIFLIASRERRDDLEASMTAIWEMERPQLVAEATPVSAPDDDAIIERGIAGRREGRSQTVLTSAGRPASFRSTSFISEAQAGDLVLQRWFLHR